MGRKIRRVLLGWQHPVDYRGNYKPLHDETWREAMRSWLDDYDDEWETWTDEDDIEAPPRPEYYRPEWSEEPIAYQVYETVSEGTPKSPVFATQDDLRAWLLEQGHSEKAADNFIAGGWAPSFLVNMNAGILLRDIDSLDYN